MNVGNLKKIIAKIEENPERKVNSSGFNCIGMFVGWVTTGEQQYAFCSITAEFLDITHEEAFNLQMAWPRRVEKLEDARKPVLKHLRAMVKAGAFKEW